MLRVKGRRHAGFPGDETGSVVGSLFSARSRESMPARLLMASDPFTHRISFHFSSFPVLEFFPSSIGNFGPLGFLPLAFVYLF
jgi:hypothetical protein